MAATIHTDIPNPSSTPTSDVRLTGDVLTSRANVREACQGRGSTSSVNGHRRWPSAAVVAVVLGCALSSAAPAAAIESTPAWTVTATSQPTNFVPGSRPSLGFQNPPLPQYHVFATNTGAAPTSGPITLTDRLPAGVTLDAKGASATDQFESTFPCTVSAQTVTCIDPEPLQPDQWLQVTIPVDVEANAPESVTNQLTVSGGGAPAVVSTSDRTTISSATPAFGFLAGAAGFSASLTGPDGSPDTQAGSHPFQLTVGFGVPSTRTTPPHGNGILVGAGHLRDLQANLPRGVIVNPRATPVRCTETELESDTSGGGCPDASAVGTISVFSSSGRLAFFTAPLYNMVPPAGVPAELGFDAVSAGIYVHLLGAVRTGGDYGLSATSNDILARRTDPVFGAQTTLWGDPSDPRHDAERGRCALPTNQFSRATCPVPPSNTPLLTMPSACSGPLTTTASVDSWESPGIFVSSPEAQTEDQSHNPAGVTGCEALDFKPTIEARPDTTVADSAAGLNFDLHVPEIGGQNTLAEANLKDAVVTLPPGVTVNPSEANGLQACASAQIDLHGPDAANCPEASKIGSVEVDTPLLDHPLPGAVYLAAQGDNPFNSVLAIYIAIDDPQTGVVVKLAGHIEADPVTGQLTTRFDETPELPFTDFKLDFFGGPRAPLITPSACGTFQTTTALTPWSGTGAASPADTFPITTGCGGGFAPTFTSGTTNNQAGAFSPFVLSLSRHDGEQRFSGVRETFPPGLSAKLAGVPLCGETEANAGTCSEASRIGSVSVLAGAGSDPVSVQGGSIFLTGPYKGAPFGESVVVPAVAGPFNLGRIVVRGAIYVDRLTAQPTIVSDPLPQMINSVEGLESGIPAALRTISVTIDRPGFAFNPTSCEALQVNGTISGNQGATAAVSSRFQAADCANLAFKPVFSAATQGKTSKANGASLVVKVSQRPGEANIHKVNLTLPLALPARLTTLQKACTEAQFNKNPAGCPEASDIGTATAKTPVLQAPLTGPAYLVSHGGAAFPDVEFVLQANERGGNVEIVLDGGTQIKKGITYSKFETVPDAPISSFETVLPEGPHSVLATNLPASAKYSFCGRSLAIPTTITGQNGAVLTQTTKVAVTGCAKTRVLTRAQKLASALKTCRKGKKKAKRAACEKQARKKYGSQAKKKTKTRKR
jgi:hypothetical protein